MSTKVYEKLGENLGKKAATVMKEALEDSISLAIGDSKDRRKITKNSKRGLPQNMT